MWSNQRNLKKNKAKDITLPDIKLYNKTIKTVWYRQKNRSMDERNRI